MEQTFSIIKPNAIKKNVIGKIITAFEKNGLKIKAIKKIHLTKQKCDEFYKEHLSRPFYPELSKFMTSSPIIVMLLEGENAVKKNRQIMGATDPSQADEGSLRKLFGDSVGENAVHGSDSLESAKREISLFFNKEEIF